MDHRVTCPTCKRVAGVTKKLTLARHSLGGGWRNQGWCPTFGQDVSAEVLNALRETAKHHTACAEGLREEARERDRRAAEATAEADALESKVKRAKGGE